MSRPIRILLVGDEADLLELLGESSADLDIEIVKAATGEDAIAKAETLEKGFRSLLKKWSSSKHSQQGENRVKIRQSIHQECRHARKTQSSSQPI